MEPPKENAMAKNRPRTETVSSTEISAVGSLSFAENGTTVVPRWYPRCGGKPILHGNREALGFVLGITGQLLTVFGVLAFIVPALLYLAKSAAGCVVDIPEGETTLPECNKTVRGLKPSSLITTLTTVLGIIMAFFVPVAGALVDYTQHRRRFGRILAFLLVCILSAFISLSEDTWFPLTVLFLFMCCVSMALTLMLHAYLPELTDQEEELNDITKAAFAIPGIANLLFVAAVIGISMALGIEGEVATARLATIMGVVFMGICFALAWGLLMQPRPALNTLEEGEHMVTQGFKQIYRTITRLYQTNISLLWFYLSVALANFKPMTGVALTFLGSHQQFDAVDLGIAAMVLLIGSIPGASVSSFMCRKVNPIRSSVICLICFIVITLIASIVLKSPEQKVGTFVVVALWGIVGGWKITSTNMLVAAVIPEGQDAELMGFYLFADASLSWLPPLIFTAMNQAGYSERVGLASVTALFAVSLIAYWKIGSYDDRVRDANRLASRPAPMLMAISEDGCNQFPKGSDDIQLNSLPENQA